MEPPHPPVPGEITLAALLVLPEAAALKEVLWSAGDTALGWLEAPLHAAKLGLQQRSALLRGKEGGRAVCMCNALVRVTEELPKEQSVSLFRAADLPVDFRSSSTLKTMASGKVEKAVPGAPPCCLRQLLVANQHRRFFFSVYR